LYEYFNSKDEIIAAVCTEGFEQFSAYLDRVPAALSPSERLTQLGMAYLDFAENNPEHFLLIFTTITPGKIPFAKWAQSNTPYNVLQQAVQSVVDAEGIELPSERTADDLAYVFWSQVHGMAMLQRTVFCRYDCPFDDVHRWVFEVWNRGLKTL
jgi:AcrR family transcriptional regulator